MDFDPSGRRPQKYLRQLRRIVLSVFKPGQAGVYLYGSWATGKAHRGSDIDLAILPKRTLRPETMSLLREKIEESDIPYRVEVLDLTQTDSKFKKLVLKEGLPWNA
jgi:hypothetical protein